jgi:hypothetical protein
VPEALRNAHETLTEDPSVLPVEVDADSLLQTTHPAQPAIVVACIALEVLGDLWLLKDQKRWSATPRITAWAATPSGSIASWGAIPVMGHSNLSLCDRGR